MSKIYTLHLEAPDLGQVLDALHCRAQSWRTTADYLESGHSPTSDFIAEECSDAHEADAIATHYERVIADIESQAKTKSLRTRRKRPERVKNTTATGFCIYIDTFFEGPSLAVRHGDGWPCVFPTEREAQLEVVDHAQTRLQEFVTGARNYEDAITIEEYIVPVTVQPDGSVIDEHGRTFAKIE